MFSTITYMLFHPAETFAVRVVISVGWSQFGDVNALQLEPLLVENLFRKSKTSSEDVIYFCLFIVRTSPLISK